MLKQWIRQWLGVATEERNEHLISAACRAATNTHFASYRGDKIVRDYVQQSVVALAKSDISAFVQSNLSSEKILDDIVARLKKKQLK